jgi:hypothetical protein
MRAIALRELIAIAVGLLALAGLIRFVIWLVFRPKLHPFPRTRP